MPTRVLDVQDELSSTVRLIETRAEAVHSTYATLSHCWGQNKVIKLTTASIGSLQHGIAVSELPALYQNAITVCRRLDIRYLWVDSLCIVQDQELDWTCEISAMGQVYSNALINIEAACAADVSGQLFFSRNRTRITPLPVVVEWHIDGPLQFFLVDKSVQREEDMKEAPLFKRAWVLQEQLLAKRSIIYSKTQLHWVCHTLEASEQFPKGVPDVREGSDLLSYSLKPRSLQYLKSMISSGNPLYFYHWSQRNRPNMSPAEQFWLSWRSIVLDYSSRSLTLEKDKLGAIAGLASVIQGKIDIQYIAGMWNYRFFIEYELCWQVSRTADGRQPYRPTEYRAPTWSWASVEGSIWYMYKEDYDMTGDTQLAFVEDVKVETLDGTTTGPIKSASMQIKGPLKASYPRFNSDEPTQAIPDMVSYLAMFGLYCDQRIWGLALRRLEFGPHKGCYERIGTFKVFDEDYDRFYYAPKTLITII